MDAGSGDEAISFFAWPIQEADNAEKEDRTEKGEGAPAQE